MSRRPEEPERGHVYFGHVPAWGDRPVLVVSNNARNRALGDVLVARITKASKPHLPSIITLPDNEPVAGRVICDDLSAIPKTSLRRHVGALSRATMSEVDSGLRIALGLA